MTMDLTEFLLARIAEDEAVARAVSEAEPKSGADVFTSLSEPTGTVEMSTARVLAECEAKRRIVAAHPVAENGTHCCADPESAYGELMFYDGCPTMRALALPYVDHPDYREEWKP